ncbi:hypothetical protein DT065_11195 [Salicibibacter kimchii]|uniref:Mannosyl-glycoprotein endo-beta-N-acetylglucosamidase-like domain-containing protein n=1 Tax=Salicibibacter kimchii TaxID=2099786 RepID=A0A345C002_9BACI|nr:peptidoglycan-binding protein [Salicibibacter kimchii]AXF56533.1 hypothetical protein DT065_11195 [Salicibibacter kimchii]
MNQRKRAMRRGSASFLATVLIVGTSLPVSAVEEIAEGANESENKDLIDVEPNVFNDSSEEVLISSELEENKDQIGLYIRDYETEEPLGIIEEFNDVDGDSHEYQWDLTVEGLDREETQDIEDGHYYIEIIVAEDDQEAVYQWEEILVHSDNAKIHLDEVNEDGIYLAEDNGIQGQVDSSLSEYEISEEAPDVEYRLEQQEEIYQEDAVTLDEDGGFQINDVLEEGTSTLIIEVTDVAGNETVEQIEIELLEEEVREERSEDKVKEEDQAEESEDNNQENKEETDEVDEPRTMQSIEVSYQDGDNGEHVYELKQDLTALGFGNFPSDPSMAYGSVTEGVVEDFQAHYDLGVTGVADEVTLAKIEKILSSPYQDGYSGDYVVELKEDLTALGYGSFPSDPSTVYGSVTEGVVKDFQEAQGLPVSGIADEITLAIISDLLDPPYQDGDTGEHIVNLKQDLTALGFGNFPSNPSTVYGSVTEGVVEDFQSYYDLDVTGNVDEATLEQMEDVLASSYQDGHSGDYVVELKEDLTALGFGNFPSDPSTVYGSVTEGVVEDFQEAQGLPVSGIADEETLASISDLFDPPHQDGDQGEHIVDLKQDLTALGFGNFPSDPSIYYGSVTEGVVEDFQSYYDLDVTGNADEATLEQMEDVFASSYQDGHSGDYVVELKEDLTTLGFGNFPSDPSTVYGSVTEGVVEDFQEAQGLPVSGIADEITLATISDLLDPPYQDGDTGEHIVNLKQDLTTLGFGNFPSDPSTVYGSVTEGVVEDFQSHYGLDVTGDADEATLAQMEEVFASSYQDGHSGDYVVELKEDLTALGFGSFPSDPSTAYGSVTEGVVKDFQEAQGLPVSGIADEITLATVSDLLDPPYQDGDTGEHIVKLKQDLTALGFGNFPTDPSTVYGSVTEGVVEDFQSYYGLDVTGVANEATISKIEGVLSSPYQDGESGDYIVEFKEELTMLGFGNFPTDPSTAYGSVTELVVKDFQSYYGLVTNGIADEVTLAKMEKILSSPYQDGNSGDYVVELKEDLTALGFGNFPSDPSTVYGSVTEGVVKDFQEAHGLPVSGIADEITLKRIESLLDGEESVFYTDYNYSITDMVNTQAHRGPRTDSYNQSIAYVSSNYIDRNGDRGTVEAGVNIRFEPNTRMSPVGRLNQGDHVTIIGTEQDTNQGSDTTWYAIEFDHGEHWQFAQAADIENNVDPNNFTLDSSHRDMYQFLVLSETSGVPVSYLDNELRDKGNLTGTGKAFSNAANEYSINEFYLLSHALLETGNGGSLLSSGSIRVGEISNNEWVTIQPNGTYIAEQNGSSWSIEQVNDFDESQANNIRSIYNMFGIGAVDSSPNVRGSIRAYEEGWFSPEEAIEGGTKFIAESYVHNPTHQQDTLYKMRWNPDNPGTHQYATDIGWAYKQTSNIYSYYQEIESLRKTFDVPRYN